jgi:hypothetical protein
VLRRLACAALLAPLFWLHRLAFTLDEWLFPKLKAVEVKQPVFILGLPRSGTTLMHRLVCDRNDFTTMSLWELLFAPALCEKFVLGGLSRLDRRLGNPLRRLLDVCQRRGLRDLQTVHPTALTAPEEDYLGLLPFGGCFLTVLARPHDPSVWDLAHFSSRLLPSRKRRLIARYRGLLARHLYFRGSGRIVVSKNPTLTSWLPELLQTFPEARVIGLRRDPRESVPSQLSSLQAGLQWFGHDAADPQIVDCFVDLLASYWRQLDEAAGRLPADRFVLIDYAALRQRPYETVTRCLMQLKLSPAGTRDEVLRERCRRAQRYVSQHHYDLESYGLEAEQLISRFPTTARHRRGDSENGVPGAQAGAASTAAAPPPHLSEGPLP